MRSPRPDEAIFVQDLLARTRPAPSSGLRTSLAQRTRFNVKSRLYERRILDDRYVPDPAGLGLPFVVTALAEGYAERAELTRQAWAEHPSVVHLVIAEGWQLGVFLLDGLPSVERLRASLNPTNSLRSLHLVACDSRRRSIPVYFDFEGAWVQAMHLPGLVAYPQGLPSSTFTEGERRVSLSPRDRAALDGLLGPPLEASKASWLRRATTAPRETRLLEDGLVGFRTFLNPVECPKWVRDFHTEIVCLLGTFRERATPEGLFADLVHAGVLPAMFASDGERVVFALLSGEAGRADRQAGTSGTTLPQLLAPTLGDIVVLRERLDQASIPVNQRFDRFRRTPTAPSE